MNAALGQEAKRMVLMFPFWVKLDTTSMCNRKCPQRPAMDKPLGNKWVKSWANHPFKESNSFVFSSCRTSYFTSQDWTCVWAPVTSVPLWPPATPRTDTSTGPSSERGGAHLNRTVPLPASGYYEMSKLYWMLQFFFFRAQTTTFNLFLYIEDWAAAAAGKFSILGEHHSVPLLKEALKQCSDWDSELKILEQWRWSVLESASSVFCFFVCFFLIFESSLPRLWPNTKHLNRSDYQVLNQIIKKTPSS